MAAALLALTLGVGMLVLAVPAAALAAEVRDGNTITVSAGETIDDDLFATGQTVTVAGRVTGDVYAIAQTVVVTGTIDGDLITGAQQVTVDGVVRGDVRAAGQQVNVNGQIDKNVTVAGQRVGLSSNGRVGGSMASAAQTVSTFGQIGRGLSVGAADLQLGGPIGGRVQAHVETLTVEPGARVAGGLDYSATSEAALSPGSVAGPIAFTQTEPDDDAPEQPPVLNGLFELGGLIWLIGSALLGALALRLLPSAPERIETAGRQRPLQSFGLGLAILLATPLVALLAAITLIGLPLTLALGLLYGLALLLAWPALALFIGTLLAEAVERAGLVRRGRILGAIWLLLIGLIALHLVTHLPWLGGLVSFLGLAFGLGLLAQFFLSRRRAPAAALDVQPAYSPSL